MRYASVDGTAKAGEDYVAVDGVLEFPPGTREQSFRVALIDDVQWEPDEQFTCVLTLLEATVF